MIVADPRPVRCAGTGRGRHHVLHTYYRTKPFSFIRYTIRFSLPSRRAWRAGGAMGGAGAPGAGSAGRWCRGRGSAGRWCYGRGRGTGGEAVRAGGAMGGAGAPGGGSAGRWRRGRGGAGRWRSAGRGYAAGPGGQPGGGTGRARRVILLGRSGDGTATGQQASAQTVRP